MVNSVGMFSLRGGFFFELKGQEEDEEGGKSTSGSL